MSTGPARDGDAFTADAARCPAGDASPFRDETDAAACLERAIDLIADDPGRAENDIARCKAWFAMNGPAASEHRATYMLAQALVVQGRLDEAEPLIASARAGFERIGDTVQALRTNLGRSCLLGELRRFDEAIEAITELIGALADVDAHEIGAAERCDLLARSYQNMGLWHLGRGRAERALDAFDQAAAYAGDGDDTETVAAIMLNRARALIELGRSADAVTWLEQAASELEDAGMRADLVGVFEALAGAQMQTVDYAAALSTIRRADDVLDEITAPLHRHEHAMTAGEAYLALHLNQESIDAFRVARDWLRDAGLNASEAIAQWGLGRALSGVDRHRDACVALDGAAQLFRDTAQPAWLARSLLDLASACQRLGERATSLALAREALAVATEAVCPVEQVRALVLCAEFDDAAPDHLDRALVLARTINLPPVLMHVLHARGRRQLADGDVGAARRSLAEAVELFEWQRSRLGHETLLGSFGSGSASVINDLVRAQLDGARADIAQAVRLADQSKSRSLVDLAHGASRGRTAADDHVMRRRRSLERDLHAAYHELFRASGQDRVRFDELSARTAEIERELSRLRLGELDAGPVHDSSPAATDPLVAIPIVSYVVLDDEVAAFVVDDGGIEVVRHLASVADIDVLVQRLRAQRDRFAGLGALAARHGERLERACRSLLGTLYELLFAPLEALLPESQSGATPRSLVISPVGVLHGVPFHALWDGRAFVRDRFTISIAPSVALFEACERRRRPTITRARVVGVSDDLAPRAEHEAAAVGRSLGCEPVIGDAARADAVLGAAESVDLLHVACHAWFRADNPMFSAIRLADRWVHAYEILDELDVSGATVVLSACESARTCSSGGDELLGLARAFLGAGASTLVASLWPADDAVTEQLMQRFYYWLPSCGPAESLRLAQCEIAEHVTNPTLWAPFVVIGAR